ncbi:MAG: replication protein RepA [Nanoarchaeota archaeon]|nr:replication protein RepA [Nanoarchaeota archaeon]
MDTIKKPADNRQNTALKKRLPAKEKLVSEILQNDIRVRILGTVIDKGEGAIVLDDGSGRLEVVTEGQAPEMGKMVRAVARILPLTGGFEARAECVQDMAGFDVELYRRAREIAKNV